MIKFAEGLPDNDSPKKTPIAVPDAFFDAVKERGEIKRGMIGTLEIGTVLHINGNDITIDQPTRIKITAVDYEYYRVEFLDEGGVQGFKDGWLTREEAKHFKKDGAA